MPQRDQHSASDAVSQVISSPEQCWNELVEQRLPADLEAQARALGAFQRVRAVSSALLRAQPVFPERTEWMEPIGRSHHPGARQPVLA